MLLVEDSEINRELLARRLTRRGFAVEIACDGVAGYRQALASLPDVVLMDMSLPEMNGWDATARLRADSFLRPIIGLTAHALTEDRERAMEAGCDAFITKPVDFDHLISAIETLALTGRPASQEAVAKSAVHAPPKSDGDPLPTDIMVAATLSEHAHAINNVRSALIAVIGELEKGGGDRFSASLVKDADAALEGLCRAWSSNAEALYLSDIREQSSSTLGREIGRALGVAKGRVSTPSEVIVQTDLRALVTAIEVLCRHANEATEVRCETSRVPELAEMHLASLEIAVGPLSQVIPVDQSSVASLLRRLHIDARVDFDACTVFLSLPILTKDNR